MVGASSFGSILWRQKSDYYAVFSVLMSFIDIVLEMRVMVIICGYGALFSLYIESLFYISPSKTSRSSDI